MHADPHPNRTEQKVFANTVKCRGGVDEDINILYSVFQANILSQIDPCFTLLIRAGGSRSGNAL